MFTIFKIIPTDPSFIPVSSNQEKAKAFLNTLFEDEEIRFATEDSIGFVDQGANFETVACNFCGQIMDDEAWCDAMDKSYKGRFEDLMITTACCNKITSLNDLNYQWPAGFAKFSIEIVRFQKELNPDDVLKLEVILDTKLRLIWALY